VEIRNAKHITVYGYKGEGNFRLAWIRDCDDVRVFGYGGNAAAYEKTSLCRVERTPSFLIANAVVRIPMMPISHSDLMPIRAERSDAGLSQCGIVIDFRQGACLFSLREIIGNPPFVALRVFGR